MPPEPVSPCTNPTEQLDGSHIGIIAPGDRICTVACAWTSVLRKPIAPASPKRTADGGLTTCSVVGAGNVTSPSAGSPLSSCVTVQPTESPSSWPYVALDWRYVSTFCATTARCGAAGEGREVGLGLHLSALCPGVAHVDGERSDAEQQQGTDRHHDRHHAVLRTAVATVADPVQAHGWLAAVTVSTRARACDVTMPPLGIGSMPMDTVGKLMATLTSPPVLGAEAVPPPAAGT